MSWNILLHRLVLEDDLRKLDQSDKKLILKAIYKKLSLDPENYGAPLRGEYKGCWKLRMGDFRVIYRIVKDKILVVVVKIGIRRDSAIYKEFIHRIKKL